MMEQYRVRRGFRACGEQYRSGDTYIASTPAKQEEAALLVRCGLIELDAGNQGGEQVGGNDSIVPALRRL